MPRQSPIMTLRLFSTGWRVRLAIRASRMRLPRVTWIGMALRTGRDCLMRSQAGPLAPRQTLTGLFKAADTERRPIVAQSLGTLRTARSLNCLCETAPFSSLPILCFFSCAMWLGGDFVGWVDERLSGVGDVPNRIQRLGQALVEPLRNIHGLSDKVLGMVLSDLLLGAGGRRSLWLDAGGGLIAIDTLVHNFFERTGILRRASARHLYGPNCYRPGGCADVIRSISANLDARQFNRGFPKDFPRFLQKAIWAYCAGQGLNICNGNKIDDLKRCNQADCRLFGKCGRVAFRAA